ncbi:MULTISPECIES: deoxyribose-phosphate aldolase [unclassified Gemella]|uniref:deoxyribose-phosphate aldolase n=1 Tax=unclassified Gemella TaxID=2624949 RepID=UPI0010742C92|nr:MULTISPECIES: deoxyribose-phosphate aldolase [unclassified Gemella]MBF0710267.1 deoxyribose-phosphate aldolase [Gemella sp. GL1.1]MBF0746305.1 deoxyribose-phosphate aldolase [Gemella sp. 19428wG2_WT2a]NYS27611.1 deoxyribose-phosphate aldolase [Gemella sp. GL1]TFU60581.1 deoxyribose-phosphate aldolase [Gemella sp. WT2a]
MKLNKYIDHTLLKATARKEEIETLCKEAKEFDFFSVCVNSSYIEFCKEQLRGTDVKIAAVVGFPLGSMSTEAKVFEAKDAIEKGANEIDMVLNISRLLDGDYSYVEDEIRAIKEVIGSNTLKVILENCYLDKKDIVKACQLAVEAGADYVKTSTGFGSGGATFEDVELMKSVVKQDAKVKASGGVRDKESALKYIELGAERLGTSSGIAIMKDEVSNSIY